MEQSSDRPIEKKNDPPAGATNSVRPEPKPFLLPPQIRLQDGNIRHVGFEFEYAGLPLKRSCELITSVAGGRTRELNRFSYKIEGTPWGDFLVESDSALLKNRRWEKYLQVLGIDDPHPLAERVENLIESIAEDLVPFEIVTPPIPMTELAVIEKLRVALHEAGALGTRAHFYAAYGMQFNPELPSFDVGTLLSYMRAYFTLEGPLTETVDIPLARRVLPYIDPFPKAYIAKVLAPDYEPTRERFMRDYLEANPTRNRPLDWLPLFTWLDRELVFGYPVEKDLIKPRPTLHYRLPSCHIDDPEWSVAEEWNKWVLIERLATGARSNAVETADAIATLEAEALSSDDRKIATEAHATARA